jgi:hypothetical protein
MILGSSQERLKDLTFRTCNEGSFFGKSLAGLIWDPFLRNWS